MFVKVIGCVRPPQSGKSFVYIKKIKSRLRNNPKSVHIILTMNTTLANSQFTTRTGKELVEEFGAKAVGQFSSKCFVDKKIFKHFKEMDNVLASFMKKTPPKVLVCCANPTRIENIDQLLNMINEMYKDEYDVHLYMDEIDNILTKKLKRNIEKYNDFNIVKTIDIATATPQDIIESTGFWSQIKLVEDKYDATNYISPVDVEFIPIDDDVKECNTTTERVAKVLDKYKILNQDTYMYIPSDIKIVSHNEMRDVIFQNNKDAVIFIINGTTKAMFYYNIFDYDNIKKIDISKQLKKDEACVVIANTIIDNKLLNRPVVVTGNNCIGRATTLTHESYSTFTHSILASDLDDTDNYQKSGRWSGRCQNWLVNKNPTKVYTTQHNITSITKTNDMINAVAANNDVLRYNDVNDTKKFLRYFEDYEFIVFENIPTREECNKKLFEIKDQFNLKYESFNFDKSFEERMQKSISEGKHVTSNISAFYDSNNVLVPLQDGAVNVRNNITMTKNNLRFARVFKDSSEPLHKYHYRRVAYYDTIHDDITSFKWAIVIRKKIK